MHFETKEQRSLNMSRIRGKNTKPEILVRKYLHSKGFRFRLNVKTLPGKPDIVLPKYKSVIFINGCFWHGHSGCKDFSIPKTRTEWWMDKISQTKKRDDFVHEALTQKGWQVIVIWTCSLKIKKRAATLTLLTDLLYHNYLLIHTGGDSNIL